MTRAIAYACLCLVTLTFQVTVMASLPEPFRLLSLPLILGIIILHERSLVLGSLWLAVFGLILEFQGLGSGYAFAGLVSAVSALGLAVSVFAKRSLWALLGLAGTTTSIYILSRWLWLVFVGLITNKTLSFNHVGVNLEQGLISISLSVLAVFIFGAYIRRLAKWFGTRFVTQNKPEYEISLPKI